MNDGELERTWDGRGRGLIKVLSWHFCGATEKDHIQNSRRPG
jgi:hypothetical protein